MEKVITENNIFVTQPSLPELQEFIPYLEQIWANKYLTNNGIFHQQFEQQLAEHLGVKYCSLFCNGTIALQVGLQALGITGEVITTPYTFPATAHAIYWNRCTPVFCDITNDFALDSHQVVKAITPRTTAILPVHVYGIPCDVDAFDAIAREYGLKVLYDAAHAFGVKKDGRSILNWGDLSMVSFHATKIFNTAEGGVLITNNAELKKKIDLLKNFGFSGETSIAVPGINGKMNEIQSALGLLQLQSIDQNIVKLKARFQYYCNKLSYIKGIELVEISEGITWNYAYCPILVNEEYPVTRDELFRAFQAEGIWPRRYFNPLISDLECYRSLSNARIEVPVARQKTEQILCLPMYADLDFADIDRVVAVVKEHAL